MGFFFGLGFRVWGLGFKGQGPLHYLRAHFESHIAWRFFSGASACYGFRSSGHPGVGGDRIQLVFAVRS